MARLLGLLAAALVLLFMAAALVGQMRERAVYEQLAGRNTRFDVIEHRSVPAGKSRL